MVSLYLWYCRPPWALTFFTEYTTIKLLLRPSIVPLNIDADPALHQYTAVGVGQYIIIVVISTKHSPAPCWRGYSTALDTVLGHLAADGTLSVVLSYTAIRASRYIVIIILTLSVVLSYTTIRAGRYIVIIILTLRVVLRYILLLELISISLILSTLCVILRYTTIRTGWYIIIIINIKRCPELYTTIRADQYTIIIINTMHCPALYYCWSWPVYHYYYQHYALPCAILLLQLTSISLLLSTLCVTLRYTTIRADQYIVININTKHCPALYYY